MCCMSALTATFFSSEPYQNTPLRQTSFTVIPSDCAPESNTMWICSSFLGWNAKEWQVPTFLPLGLRWYQHVCCLSSSAWAECSVLSFEPFVCGTVTSTVWVHILCYLAVVAKMVKMGDEQPSFVCHFKRPEVFDGWRRLMVSITAVKNWRTWIVAALRHGYTASRLKWLFFFPLG